MKKWCITLLLCVASMIWADTIELKDGRILGGTIKDTTDERFINIETYDRSLYSIDRNEVVSINYGEDLEYQLLKRASLLEFQPTAVDYLLEGMGGFVGGVVGAVAGVVGGVLVWRSVGGFTLDIHLVFFLELLRAFQLQASSSEIKARIGCLSWGQQWDLQEVLDLYRYR